MSYGGGGGNAEKVDKNRADAKSKKGKKQNDRKEMTITGTRRI